LQKLIENLPRLILLASPRVSNGQTAAGKMRFLLRFRIKRDRFGKVPLLAIRRGKSRIQVKVTGIKLLRPLALDDGVIEPVIRQVSRSGDVANNRRNRIQLFRFQHKLEPFFHVTAEERQQGKEKVYWR
jgi:hypothetical protein